MPCLPSHLGPQGLAASLSIYICLSQRGGNRRQREHPPGLEPDPPLSAVPWTPHPGMLCWLQVVPPVPWDRPPRLPAVYP